MKDSSTAAAEGKTELFVREEASMLRLAVLLVGQREVAEDVVADAFAAVSERWDRLDNPGGYLRVCVVNGCRMVNRRRHTERRAQSKVRPPEIDSAEMPEPLIELHAALARLGDRPRTVMVLRYLNDMSDEEIARLLGCRPATVRSIVRRALLKLRKELT